MVKEAAVLIEEKKDNVATIQGIPLLSRSNARRTQILIADNKSSLPELV